MVSTVYGERRQLVTVSEARQMDGEGAHRMVIAANELSRNGDELNLRGVAFKNYLKNPVVLWAHDSFGGVPIAKTLEIAHDDQGRIVADFQFNSEDEFASRVENAWNGGFIRAASIRYLPTKVVEVRGKAGEVERFRIEESELLEWSLVPIPADPDSVRAAARALNLPEEIFRALEPEPHSSLQDTSEKRPRGCPAGPPGEQGPPGIQEDPYANLRERVDALEHEIRAVTSKTLTSEEYQLEPLHAPASDDAQDSVLTTVGSELAAIVQMIEEK